MSGWIKLHRKFLEWGWYSDTKTKVVFLDLLLNANHKDNDYRGMTIKRGQLTTSQDAIAKRTGLSRQNVRTALSNLVKTQEINLQTNQHFTLITICKYEDYQNENYYDNQQTNQQLTNNQPTTNQQLTTNKNEKNDNNEININREGESVEVFGEFKNVLITPTEFKALSAYGYDPKDVVEWYSAAKASRKYTSENDYASIKTWGIPGYIETQRRQGKQGKQSGKTTTSGSLNDLSREDFWELMRKKYDN